MRWMSTRGADLELPSPRRTCAEIIFGSSGERIQTQADVLALVPQSDLPLLPPIHIVFTSSASYVTGLLALVNSTLVTSSPATRDRLRFHIVSSDSREATQVVQLLNDRFGSTLGGKLTPYGLAEMHDDRLEHVKVWAGYRSESLSKVRPSLPRAPARRSDPEILPFLIPCKSL